jgi:hypothetical protein
MEKHYDAKPILVVLECETCYSEMKEYKPYPYYTWRYYYECQTCGKKSTSEKKYPYIKHVRKDATM